MKSDFALYDDPILKRNFGDPVDFEDLLKN
jgi:hypothetical protein